MILQRLLDRIDSYKELRAKYSKNNDLSNIPTNFDKLIEDNL